MNDYNYIVLATVRLAAHHRPTGWTQHFSGGRELPPPAELWVAQLPEAPGFYLLYLDEQGQEMNDTYHDSFDQALDQAEKEFGIASGEWVLTGREST